MQKAVSEGYSIRHYSFLVNYFSFFLCGNTIDISSRLEVFYEKDILKNFCETFKEHLFL